MNTKYILERIKKSKKTVEESMKEIDKVDKRFNKKFKEIITHIR